MSKQFLSRRGWIIYLPLAIFPFIFSFVFLLVSREDPEGLLPLFWIFVPLYIFLLSILKTRYTIDGDELRLRMSFFRKRIPVSEIKKVTIGSHVWFAGWKYALSTRGIVITYGKYLDVLVSPEHQEEFIAELKRINPAIVVESKK